MTTDLKPIPRGWSTVALLWFVVCSNYVARLMITTMHGSIPAAIPMTEAQFGLLTSALLLVYGALQPFAGFLGDRFSRSRVIIWSMAAWSVTTLLTAFSRTFAELLFMRTLMGLSEALYMPAALALITDYHRGPTRSLATGIHMAGMYVGCSLAGLGGWLAERRSWNFAFGVVGAAGVAFAALLLFTLRDAPREGDRESAGGATRAPPSFGVALASLFRSGSFLLVLVFFGFIGTTGWLLLGWMPIFLQGHFHLRQGAAGLSATGYLNAAALLGVLVGGAWAGRWARTNARACILVPLIGLLAAGPGVWMTAQASSYVFAMLGLTLYGLTIAFTQANIMPILCLITDPRYRATGFGVINLGNQIGGGLGIYAAGALMDAHVGLGKILTGTAGCLMLCTILLFFVRTANSGVAREGSR
jgi:predicted MFS family arabinose efflux permease